MICLNSQFEILSKEKEQQHLIDVELLNKIADLAEIKKNEIVLEIGGGLGNLTEILSKRASKVYTIEIDKKLTKILKEKFYGKNVYVIEGDALKIDFPKFNKIVSNLPYSTCAGLFQKLINYKFDIGVFTVPEGFAAIITAKKGDQKYSKFSMMVNLFYEIDVIQKISKEKFFPIPSVNAALIKIKPKEVKGEELLLKLLFLQSDKKIKNALREALIKAKKINKRKASEIVKKLEIQDLSEKKISNLSEENIDFIIQKLKMNF